MIKDNLDRLRLLVEQSELWVSKKSESASSESSRPAATAASKYKSKEEIDDELAEGPDLDSASLDKYHQLNEILQDMIELCVSESTLPGDSKVRRARKNDQRLVRNMGVHNIVLELTKISYATVEDRRMQVIMREAHRFLQCFCYENVHNQKLLHECIDFVNFPSNEWEAATGSRIFKDNLLLCNEVNEQLVQNYVQGLESQVSNGAKLAYLEFLQTICLVGDHPIKKNQDMIIAELVNSELINYGADKMNLDELLVCMQKYSEGDLSHEMFIEYNLKLIQVLVSCTHGKNTFAEIKCNQIINLDDIEKVITFKHCLLKVKDAYLKLLYHCHIDTENEARELFATSYMWSIIENFVQDLNSLLFSTSSGEKSNSNISSGELQNYLADNMVQVLIGFFGHQFFNNVQLSQVDRMSFIF
jgi:hypothetical protein